MSNKLMDFISRLRDPADRAEMARRFGADVVDIVAPRRGPIFGIGGIAGSARHDPPPRPDAPSDGIIRDEASLMAQIRADRIALGLDPLVIDNTNISEEERAVRRQIDADRRRLGMEPRYGA